MTTDFKQLDQNHSLAVFFQAMAFFCVLYPLVWLYLPNIAIIYYSDSLGLSLKTLGLLITVFCTIPLTLMLSMKLRDFYLWNIPFALVSGLYAVYIIQYHDIPYEGMWFALWNTSLDTVLGVTRYFSFVVKWGFLGFILYCLCLCHPLQKHIKFSKSMKQYVLFGSLVCVALILNTTNFLSKKIAIQRVFDESVLFKNYPYGMLMMMGKTYVALSKQEPVHLPPIKRAVVPNEREVYVFVIGEASRNDYWHDVTQATNPHLLNEPDLHVFDHVVSQANLTSIALPLLLTGMSTMEQAHSNPIWPLIAKAAGCSTGWLTNSTEPFNYAYQNDFYDLNVDRYALVGLSSVVYDDVLISEVKRAITQGQSKLCLVVHLIGSHFDYRERYRSDLARYAVDNGAYTDFSSPKHDIAFRNAYKNSLIETNILLQGILDILKKEKGIAFMLYTADHAESFGDDQKHQFFHGNFDPNQVEFEVPFFIWANTDFQRHNAEKWANLIKNQNRKISGQQILPTLMDALSISPMPAYLSPSLLQQYPKDVKSLVLLPQMHVVAFDSLRKG